MMKLPAGKDKVKGEYQYYRCGTCTKPIKVYKKDCINKILPKSVAVCKNCLPKLLKKENN